MWRGRGPGRGGGSGRACTPQEPPETYTLHGLTGTVVEIAVMNLQPDPLGVQGRPNGDAHVVWELVTLLDGGRLGSQKG